MALSCHVGSFAEPVAINSAYAVTGVGFQPKALIFWSEAQSTVDGSSPNGRVYLGLATGSAAQVCAGMNTVDAMAASNAQRWLYTTRCISYAHSAAALGVAALVSLDADGMTLNFSVVPGNQRLHHYLALGGDDLTHVKAGNFTSRTTTGNQSVTSVGFQPDCVVLIGTLASATGEQSHSLFALGVFTATAQWASSVAEEHNQATMNTYRRQRTDRCFSQLTTGNAVGQEATFVSMDADGFTINFGTANATGRIIGYLALKGGQVKVGSISQKTSIGTQGYTGIGFQPVGLMLASVCAAASSVTQDHARFALGAASSATTRGATWLGSTDAAADSVTDSAFTRTVALTMQAEGTPTENARSDLDSFDADGFTLDWEVADATAREVLYLAFGSAAVVGGGNRRRRVLLGAAS